MIFSREVAEVEGFEKNGSIPPPGAVLLAPMFKGLPSEEVGWEACEVEAVGCSEFLVLFPESEVSFENFFIFRFIES